MQKISHNFLLLIKINKKIQLLHKFIMLKIKKLKKKLINIKYLFLFKPSRILSISEYVKKYFVEHNVLNK